MAGAGEGNRSTPMLVRMFFGRGLDQCAHPDRQYDHHRASPSLYRA
jgi:hypothetical protein